MDQQTAHRFQQTLADVFDDIVTGRGVRRSKHELLLEGRDVTSDFLVSLKRHGYEPATVSTIAVEPGERVPAFYVEETTAYFGWVFWEKFTERKLRKLWGSVVRNAKGDWAIQIPPTSEKILYANTSLKIGMDIDRPSAL